MKRILFLALVAVVFLTGCVEYGITIKVNKDGSGEIVENMLLSNQIMNMAKVMGSDGDAIEAFSKETQMKKAPQFGENVVFDKFEEINTETKQGYKVVYKFSDINKVHLSEDMFDDTIDSLTEGMDDEGDEGEKDDATDKVDNFFKFDYNKSGKLTINNGFSEAINEAKKEEANRDKKKDKDTEEISDKELEKEMAMAKMFVQGMRFYMKVEFDTIKDANVPYENNQVTLFEIDMDKLMNNKENFKVLMKNKDSEMTKILKNEKKIDGVIFHQLEKIVVNFK